MNTILVPTDFSECAFYAFEYAVYLTHRLNAELHLVNIANNEDDKNTAEIELKKLEQQPSLKGLRFTSHIKKGSIDDAVFEIANDKGVDLIVMGSHGTSGINEIIIGSNAEKIVSKATFNVLTIKQKINKPEFTDIVFASDFSEEADDFFDIVLEFAKLFNSKIHLLKVNTPDYFEPTKLSEKRINDFIERQNLNETYNNYAIALYADSNQELGILNYCIDSQIDLIAIGTHHRSAIAKVFKVSTSKNLVNHSFRPVLTLTPKKG